jgi:hypothetical protein
MPFLFAFANGLLHLASNLLGRRSPELEIGAPNIRECPTRVNPKYTGRRLRGAPRDCALGIAENATQGGAMPICCQPPSGCERCP